MKYLLCAWSYCHLMEKRGLGPGLMKERPGPKHQINAYIVNDNYKVGVVWG